MPIQAGERAPDATLAIRPREYIRLHEQLGEQPVVLLFFPFAYSGVCTTQMCAIAEDWSPWASLGAKVFAISVDSPYVQERFARDCGARFPFLSDFNREATRAFGIERPDIGGLRGASERAAFVIDREGVVVYAWVGEHPGLTPDFEPIREAVAAAG